ncbi:hypothetical protein BDZ89DRAFT_281079 [Hymenopellis radicata]|nr:hypothetical protein BDZ89DRAFT_281079 [Hymenopellis radicata]
MRAFIAVVLAASAALVAASPVADLEARVPFFSKVFDNQTAATQSPSYMTFTLVDPFSPVTDCVEFCIKICDCKAVNVYLDNGGKGITLPDGKAAQYTCSAFSDVIDTSMNTNAGGQDEHGDGQLNFITRSSGWVRNF